MKILLLLEDRKGRNCEKLVSRIKMKKTNSEKNGFGKGAGSDPDPYTLRASTSMDYGPRYRTTEFAKVVTRKETVILFQCCGYGMFIPDRIPEPHQKIEAFNPKNGF
jgi:hypothetical protein